MGTDDKALVLEMPPSPPAALAATEHADDMMAALARAAANPNVDPARMEALLKLHRDLTADRARVAYAAAMARLQAKVPKITKHGRIEVNGALRSRFAKLEDVDDAIRPLCAEEGFSFGLDARPVATGIEYSCKMSHRDGHSETKTIILPADQSGGKNNVQAVGSSTSYAQRYLLKMHLNIVERDEDDDGNGGARPITQAQADDLRMRLAEVKGDERRFLAWARVQRFEDILETQYGAALRMIADKAKTGAR